MEIPLMADPLAELRYELAIANRIVANEGVVDAFGHVSVRNPNNPNSYFISRHRAPEIVESSDIVELDLDSKPAAPTDVRLYSERVIHGEIYKARPDVMSVCHHHSPSIMPYCITGVDIVPVYHLGATLGGKVPFWDQRDEFGETNLLVIQPEEGRSLARALGPHWMVLMRRHGATVAGTSLRELVFRTVYTCRNAELQSRAQAVGTVGALTAGEVAKASAHNLRPAAIERAYDYWLSRVAKAGLMPSAGRSAGKPAAAAVKARKTAKAKAKPRKTAARRRR
jgi:ribulose-5-phosphate 4-epimerase/fuculose-1-phosphate aldolase